MERGEVFVLPRAAYFTFPPFPQPSQPRFQVLSTCKREPWERGCLSPSGEGRQTLEASEKKCGDVFATIEIKSESMGAPGRRATCYLSDFDETWPV